MEILQLIPNIASGGGERFTVDLSNELVKDCDVTLLTLYDESETDLFRDQLNERIRIITLGKHVGFDWKILVKLYQIIKRISPDVIHTHLRAFNYLMPLLPMFNNNTSVIHTVHSNAFMECHNDKIRAVRGICFQRENVLPVTISSKSTETFEEAYNNVQQKLIYNGRKFPSKTSAFKEVSQLILGYKKNDCTKVFVHIGRMGSEKNQLMLVKAFNRLIHENEANAVLVIIGAARNTKSSRQILQQLKQAEQEYEHIQLLGEKANATDYLHVADFFCLSSLYEGMPITLIEAFATGTIPVCTPVGGIPEMVSDLNASLLAEKVDADNYYRALQRAYLMSGKNQQNLKEKATQLFRKKYSIEKCAAKYLHVYKKLDCK